MRYEIFLFLTVFICQLQAQNKVQVIDKIFNSPIEDVNVMTYQRGTTTNKEGFFHIKNLSPVALIDSITFSIIGYTTQKLSLAEIKNSNNIVYLSPKSELINEVTVIGEKQLKESISFEELSPMKEGVFAFGVALVGDSIFVIGGDMSVKNAVESKYQYEHNSGKMQIYDIRRDKWNIPRTRISNRAYHNVHYYDGKIFILGGKRLAKNKKLEFLNDNVEVYNINDDIVYSSQTNPHQAVNFASGLYQENIIVMNGSVKKYRNENKITEQVHLFDLRTGYWYQLDDMPCSYETTGIVVDSIFYHIGGIKKKTISYMNAYNIITGRHRTERIFPLYLERPALTYNEEKNTIYIYENSTIFICDLLKKEALAYNIDLDLMYSQMVYKDGYLYIIGGRMLTEMSILKDNYGENGASRGYESTLIAMPSECLYRIDIKEFEFTKSYKVNSP